MKIKNLNVKSPLVSYVVSFVIAFALTACGNAQKDNLGDALEKIACIDDCQKACCLGCAAEEGNKKCIILENGSMPCCIANAGEETHINDYYH